MIYVFHHNIILLYFSPDKLALLYIRK